MPANVTITETWERTSWRNWDTYLAGTSGSAMGRVATTSYPWGLRSQNHTDIADFLESGWTGGAFGYQTTLNNLPGAQVNVTSGLNTLLLPSLDNPLDLTQTGYVIMALPDWPGTPTIDLGNSYIDFSSDGGITWASLQFADSSPSPNTAGMQYVKFPTSMLTGANFAAINSLRIRLTATTSSTVYLAGLRLVSTLWVASNVDYDNSTDRLVPCVPLNGDPTSVVPGNQIMPVLWRSATVTGVDNPRPINASISFVIRTGSNLHNNQFTFYMREQTTAYITQINLDGTPQSALDGRPQPSSGVNETIPRTMLELDTHTIGDLEGLSMSNLERVPDATFSSWQAFQIQWGMTPAIAIFNSANPTGGYTYTGSQAPALAAHTTYMVICDLVETGAQMRVFPVETNGMLGLPIFDTQVIEDGSTFLRQAGRIGFQAFLADGDTSIESIRPSSLMFAEYQSAPLTSITPVSAARLYAQYTPNTQLWREWMSITDGADHTPNLAPDHARTITGQSTAVTINSPSTAIPVQGVITNTLSPFGDTISGITDFDQLSISFSLWFPSAALSPTISDNPPIVASLVNPQGGEIPLTMPVPVGNQWQSIILTLPTGVFPPGLYALQLRYYGMRPAKFWIDNVQITQRAIAWAARSVIDDPWFSNYAPWTPFNDLVNNDNEGVRFTTVGNQLQIQAQALRQDASIFSPIHALPIYAQLGRLVFPDDVPQTTTPNDPIASIITTVVSEDPMTDDFILTFDGLGSTPGNHQVQNSDGTLSTVTDPIVGYQWSFGDGNYSTQPVATHDYHPVVNPTTYQVTLTVVDSYGRVGLTSTTIDV